MARIKGSLMLASVLLVMMGGVQEAAAIEKTVLCLRKAQAPLYDASGKKLPTKVTNEEIAQQVLTYDRKAGKYRWSYKGQVVYLKPHHLEMADGGDYKHRNQSAPASGSQLGAYASDRCK